jgi:hypothetical protein
VVSVGAIAPLVTLQGGWITPQGKNQKLAKTRYFIAFNKLHSIIRIRWSAFLLLATSHCPENLPIESAICGKSGHPNALHKNSAKRSSIL